MTVSQIDMSKLDVAKTNVAIDRLLEVTENLRHRFLLQAYHRHRFLEIAGRYEEIFAADMMVPRPVYHFQAAGINARLEGQDAVKSLYRMWSETNQTTFYAENEQIAVADNFIASTATVYQQVWGRSLTLNKALSYMPAFLSRRVLDRVLKAKGLKADENAMYLFRNEIQMFWPYDDRGRLVGEDVWEPDPDKAQIIKLDRASVVTTQQAGEKLAKLIQPLLSFDEAVLGKPAVPVRRRTPASSAG